jgi:GSH-dependent disulfide-bond oxidoreductase
VLDRRFADHEYVVNDYSIADIAIWPWVPRYEWQTIDLNADPNVKPWIMKIATRPAARRSYKIRRMGAIFQCP